MNFSSKLESMKSGEVKNQTSKNMLAITNEVDSLSKLAESTAISLSRNTINARAYELIDEISAKMREKIYMIFIFDESGSMYGTEDDMEEGYRQLVSKYKNDNILITTVLFSKHKKVLYIDVPISDNPGLRINPDGNTRLYDTAIETIEDFDRFHPDVTNNALFIIATDGKDNESSYSSIDRLRELVKEGIAKGRKFYFLGDSIDAINTAEEMGISEDNAVQYSKEDHGFIVNFLAISNIVNEIKNTGTVSRNWKKPIEEHLLSIEEKTKKYQIRL